MNNVELAKHNYLIKVSDDLQSRVSAKKLSQIFNIIVPHAKGGGNSNMCSGIYYDTVDGYYFNLYNKLISELINEELL